MKTAFERLINGIFKENPTFVLMLGMCPTLAVTSSALNGLGMGLGFTIALTLIGIVRELFGSGTLFGFKVMPDFYEPISILVLSPGAFLVLALLAALQNKLKAPSATNKDGNNGFVCSGNCAECHDSTCHIGDKEGK